MEITIPLGYPGSAPRWTASAKTGVGTAINPQSRVWFTISQGILNEIYYPDIDQPNTCDMQFLVVNRHDLFREEKRDTTHRIRSVKQGVPAFQLTNTCEQGWYRIHKTIITDPERDVLLQHVHFEPIRGKLADFNLYALLATYLTDLRAGNDAWISDYRGVPMLFGRHKDVTFAMACSVPFTARSCGYVGTSDGWQDISRHNQMTWFYPQACDGNVALTAEIDLHSSAGKFVLAIAFGRDEMEAGQQARASLMRDFDQVLKDYTREWTSYQSRCQLMASPMRAGFDLYRVSTAILKSHDSKRLPGGQIASLSLPCGEAGLDGESEGCHVVWSREPLEAAGALLAAGDAEDARRALFYMMTTQEAEGHWLHNTWVDGMSRPKTVQLDETACFLLLADVLRRGGQIGGLDVWPAVRRAAEYLVANGPVTQRDRWETVPGYSVFTLAVSVAALLCAADFADEYGEPNVARYLRETADHWNENIERWTYVNGAELAQKLKVDGYYIRVAPPESAPNGSVLNSTLRIENRQGEHLLPAAEVVGVDALALVRFGLRQPDDPRILDTIKVIDAQLKSETKTGPMWRRYSYDGYSEQANGRFEDSEAVGHGWPLLAGERAHYELAAGNREEAQRLCEVMAAQASAGGLLPEQVSDEADILESEIYNGCPTGSGMPLVWAHAEYIKLVRSLNDGRVFDMPPQTVQRYQVEQRKSQHAVWRFNYQLPSFATGKTLRIELRAPARVRWTADNWRTWTDTPTFDPDLGINVADLQTAHLPHDTWILFTFYWPQTDRWEGIDFAVQITTPQ